jgi:hypothetical protein
MSHNNPAVPGYELFDRRMGAEKLVVVLAGYKEFCWHYTFPRLKRFVPADVDVCVVSGGVGSKEANKLAVICAQNAWSYLRVSEDNLPLVTALPIQLHLDARLIWKIDEDVFVTENFFKQTLCTYEDALRNSRYRVGFVAPLMNVNGYGTPRILEKLAATGEFSKRFGRPRSGAYFLDETVVPGSLDAFMPVHADPEASLFMWGHGGVIPAIDELDRRFSAEDLTYSVCPHRFSIGAILLPRATWEKLGRFRVRVGHVDVGAEERELCNWCMDKSHAVIIAENTVVGHLSFGLQTPVMRINLALRPELFVTRTADARALDGSAV